MLTKTEVLECVHSVLFNIVYCTMLSLSSLTLSLSSFSVIPPNSQAGRIFKKLRREPVTLQWHSLSYKIYTSPKRLSLTERKLTTVPEDQQKFLLREISGSARPGEIVAIMGSSGAGKTTLLNALAGRIRIGPNDSLTGNVSVNGKVRDDRWRRTAGYVEQFDLMYGLLTVQETIQFAADFKLPSTLSHGEKRAIVDRVIDLLGLGKVRFSRIGTEEKRGISGGEKKRVAIAVELVTFPGLLFLDEPTTGLDSTTALSLIETLRNVAKKTAMTIVLTIHQPRASILSLFTRVMFMSQGRLIFNGTLQACLDHFEKEFNLICPERENPADFIMDMLTVKPGDEESAQRVASLQARWAEIESSNSGVEDDMADADATVASIDATDTATNAQEENVPTGVIVDIPQSESDSSPESHRLDWPNARIVEFGLLLKRNFMLLGRDHLTAIANLVQTIFLCLLLSFVFFQLDDSFSGVQGRLGLLFFICINVVFTTVVPLLPVFAVDRAILMRERASAMYRVLPSYSAKFVSLLPFSLFLLLLFCIPLYFIAGLTMPFDRLLVFLVVLLALRLAAMAMGLFIASISPSLQISQIIGPLLIVIFFIFGGNLANSNEITWILRWIQYISMIFYSYQALCQNEFDGNFYGVQNDSNTLVPGSTYLELYGLDQVGIWGCFGAILGIGAVFWVAGYIGLRISTRPKITFI